MIDPEPLSIPKFEPPPKEAVIAGLACMKHRACPIVMSGAQIALLVMAAQEAMIQDPERNWIPKGFEHDLVGAMWTVTAILQQSFEPAVRQRILETWQRIEASPNFFS